MISNKFKEKTKKISSKNFKIYVYKNNSWILSDEKIPKNIIEIVKKYENNNNLIHLIDEYDKKFLKGMLNSNNEPIGKRIKYMPNGKKLARAGFAIFAKKLGINEKDEPLWDVVYENISGSKTYLYDEDKIEFEQKKKAKIVDEFTKEYPKIIKKLNEDIKNKNDIIYLALKIMLKTFIRVGNLEYFHHLGHKGLTTLQKNNIKIDEKNDIIIFDFIGKDAVEQHIEKKFTNIEILKLKKILNKKNENDFVFASKNNFPIHSNDFSKILFKYTKKHFYPHIIRSYHADNECKKFIKKNKTSTKKEIEKKFLQIANDLGHKNFNKKNNTWEVNFKVTLNNYIRPKYSKKMIEMYKK